MDTAEALRKAIQAVKDSGIPEDLWPTALPLAFADVRGDTRATGEGPETAHTETPPPALSRRKPALRASRRSSSSRSTTRNDEEPSSFATAASDPNFLEQVARQTDTRLEDLKDVFHVENGALRLKVPGKDLGTGDKPKTKTVTALMGGAVFAGTDVASIPFSEIHQVCKTMRCFSPKHAAEYVRETEGFGAIGSGKSAALTHKTGWEKEFSQAVDRVLGRAGNGS